MAMAAAALSLSPMRQRKQENEYDIRLKIIIIGDAGSGKSCIIRQFLDGVFNDQSEHTIGVEFASKVIKVNSKRVKLQIWDTAGQQRCTG